MKYLRYFALLAVCMFAASYSHAQVEVGIGVGGGYGGYAYGPPVCTYGYYDYAPYACAPYGYWGPDYFVNGLFIGVGPWYGWGYGRGLLGGRRADEKAETRRRGQKNRPQIAGKGPETQIIPRS